MILIKNAQVYAPEKLGNKDILTGGGKILAIEDNIEANSVFTVWDAQGKIVLPGFIDQHQHIIGAGGKHGFASMSPEVKMSQLVGCGTTTVVGLLGTDGTARSIKTLYAKCKALDMEGVSAYMFTGYFGLEPMHITQNIQEEMIYIDKVLGCKIAIADVRSSFPTDTELLRVLRQVRVGGLIAKKKGILHVHLGSLTTKLDSLLRLVTDFEFPIENISPTHCGRTLPLFEESIKFGKLGGMIDITTGASQYDKPHRSVLYAMEKGLSIDKMSFSSDGNAGLDKKDESGNLIGFRKAPIDTNYLESVALVQQGGIAIEEAFKLITINPAINLGLTNKGRIAIGADADLCCLDDNLKLTDVFAHGKQMMENSIVIAKDSFE